jgi:hypothetical protein
LCFPLFSVTQKLPPHGAICAVAPLAVFQLPSIGSAACAERAESASAAAMMSVRMSGLSSQE